MQKPNSENAISVFMISGSDEYQSHSSLRAFASQLEQTGSFRCTVSEATDGGDEVPELDTLFEHDVLLVFCRRLALPADAIRLIQKWCWLGRPVVGIRTACHGFQTWLEFDREILGGSYAGHGPLEPDLPVRLSEKAKGHVLSESVSGWISPMKVYRNPELAPDCTVILNTKCDAGHQPLAWCRTVPETGGRVFNTSLGETADFKNPDFIRLLQNALEWTACRRGDYRVAHLADMQTVKCPCGNTRRAFATPDNPIATLHMVDITEDSQAHYHRKLTELYLILEGEGVMELNGRAVPVKALDTILIERGCRHRAVGDLRIVNIPIPSFDPQDEWFL